MMIAVWFSCGVASAAAAKLTVERYPDDDVRIIYNPVLEEDLDNLRFLGEVEAWLNKPIEIASNQKYPSNSIVEVFAKRRYMSGIAGAPCTVELKKKARQQWEIKNNPDYHVLGFTADEKHRHDRFVKGERDNVIPILIDKGWDKKDCMRFVFAAGINPPRVYDLGFSNANCIGCVKATSPTYWNHVRKHFPAVFEERAMQSRELGARLVRNNGERLFLDELPVDAVGDPLGSYQIECGIFCNEKED